MSLNFTEEYFPDIDELGDDQIALAREQVVAALQPAMPDVDLAPGTPTGDFVVTPLAVYRAAAKEANSRLMSDLDLANVAEGLIYSCDFVKAYLGNFAVYDVDNLKAAGLVRLTFSSSSARTIPRAARFRFGSSDDWSPKVTDPETTELTILSAGSSSTGDHDTYTLSQTAANTWAVDIPVEGVMTAPVTSGAGGTSTMDEDELVGIAAAIEFMSGVPSSSLSELAKMARKVSFSLTTGSRASTRSLIYRNWPETNMASPVIPGDQEMQRVAAGSSMALQAPSMDIYFRSARDMQRETQNVRLDYVQPSAGGAKVFRGKLSLLHRPSRITSLEWSGTSTVSNITSHTVFSKSTRSDLDGCLHCGTRFEDLYVSMIPVLDGGGTPLIPLSDDGLGNQYAIFTVSYDADPLLESVSSLLESPEYRPAGVDVLVKSGPLVEVDDLVIRYTRQAGVKTTLSAAADLVSGYFRGVGYPTPFQLTELHDIMRNAGASRVLSVGMEGNIYPSAATRLIRDDISDPSADLTGDWPTYSDLIGKQPFYSTGEIVNPNIIVDGEISVGGPPTAWAATERTVRYVADIDNIRFIEN